MVGRGAFYSLFFDKSKMRLVNDADFKAILLDFSFRPLVVKILES